MLAFSCGDAALAGSGMISEIEIPWSGEMPQVTVGSMSAALMRTMSSNFASASEAKDNQRAAVASKSLMST